MLAFVLAIVLVGGLTLWSEWLWRRSFNQAMRHRRGIKRGRGHTRREEDS